MEWQPMRTAPKGGTMVLLWGDIEGDQHMVIGASLDGRWDVIDPDSGCEAEMQPTHWMPLPTPPDEA